MTDELTKVTEDMARGGFFLFSGATLATVVMAISAIIIGRFLGPDLYGQYNLVLVIPSLLLLFSDLGINAGVTKFSSSLRAEGKSGCVASIIYHGILFRLGIGIILSILSLVFAGYFALLINRPDSSFLIQIASLSVIFQVAYTTTNSAFVGLDKSEYSALATNIQAIAKTILQITLVLLGFNLVGALIGYVGGFAVASIMTAVILFKFLRPAKKNKAFSAAESGADGALRALKILVRYGMPLYVSVVLTGLFPLYQQVVLAFFVSDAAIGNFRAAANFVTLLAVIPTAITTALLPAFSKLESTPEHVSEFFRRANKYSCLLILPATTLVILFSRQIVQFVYGSLYDSAALFLSASVLIHLLVALGYLGLPSLFNGIGKTRLTLKMTLINFLVLAVLSPIFAQVYGVMGVIVAFLIAGTVASIYAACIAIKRLEIRFDFKQTGRIYMISVLSSLVPLCLLLSTSFSSIVIFIIGTILFLLVYITLMPLVGIVDAKELVVLSNITKNIPLLKALAKPLLANQQRILIFIGKNRHSK
jgi:O-antigen/teichoic acid export membrane protein